MDAVQQSPETVKTGVELPKGPPKPVYFLSLEVENVRSFKDRQKLNLADSEGRPKRWTVLLGDNGVGKTTLLQILAWFQPVPMFPPPQNKRTQTVEPSVPRLFWEHLPARTSFVREESAFMRCLAALCYGAELNDPSCAAAKFELETEIAARTRVTSHFPAEAASFLCCGYGASRRMSQHALTESRNEDACKTLFDEDEPLLNAEEWLLQADYAAVKSDSEVARKRRDQIKDILTQVLPDVEDLRIRPGDNSLKAPAVEAKTPYGWVRLRNLSSGYRSLVAWMVDLASRLFEAYPESTNPLAEPVVVLVDQIDLFMHPKWQVNLIKRLVNLFPNAQFIATAHSPLIVQAAEDANIVVLRREGDHVVIDNDPARVRGWRVDQVLTSDIFGLPSTRGPETEARLQERRSLLAKPTLSEADRERLKQLDLEVAGIPFVESPQDVEAMELIRKAAEKLRHPAEVK